MKKNEKMIASKKNLALALKKLEEFVASPIEDQRDEAGIIQAFEYSFELFWKTSQKTAENEGLAVASPKQALKVGLQLGILKMEEEEKWLQMLEDRNLTSHTYREEVAKAVLSRIISTHLPLLKAAFSRIK